MQTCEKNQRGKAKKTEHKHKPKCKRVEEEKASGGQSTIKWSRMCLATLCGLLLLGIQIERAASAPAGEDAAATTMPPLDTTTDAPDAVAATTTPATTAAEQSSSISSITTEAADGSTTSTTTTTEAANKSNATETGESKPKAMKIIDRRHLRDDARIAGASHPDLRPDTLIPPSRAVLSAP